MPLIATTTCSEGTGDLQFMQLAICFAFLVLFHVAVENLADELSNLDSTTLRFRHEEIANVWLNANQELF